MGEQSDALINALNTSAKALQEGIVTHCCLMNALSEGALDEDRLQLLVDRCPKRSREIRLEKAVSEAIDVLDASRKAFKSRKLEILRKKLTHVLTASD